MKIRNGNRKEGTYDMAAIERRYIKLGIPVDDRSVLEWLERQHNMSDSIRALIRADVENNGYDDVFCRTVIPRGRVGRPRNAEVQLRDQEDTLETETKVPMTQSKSIQPKSSKQVVEKSTVTNPTKEVPVETDEDGFVDPLQLLGF